MAEGSKTYRGLAVPLYGCSEIKQSTAETDILTLTAITGGSGDYLVAQTAGGGEMFSAERDGTVNLKRLNLGDASPTTAPTTGLSKGDLFVVWSSATHPVLGMVVSGATQLVQYIAGFNADTLGIPS